jgi:hypothetical protein
MSKLMKRVLVGGLFLICILPASADWKNVAGEWDQYRLNEQQRAWFKSVRSRVGVPCCDITDGHPTAMDHRRDGYYIPDPRDTTKEWLRVPDEALTKQKINPVGVATVWYKVGSPGIEPEVYIRCFVPESET